MKLLNNVENLSKAEIQAKIELLSNSIIGAVHKKNRLKRIQRLQSYLKQLEFFEI